MAEHEGLVHAHALVRAGSWTQNVGLIKHLSNVSQEGDHQALEGIFDALKSENGCPPPQRAQLPAAPAAKANSTDSTSTAHRGSGAAQQDTQASMPHASLLGPLRQTSLDMLAASELRASMQPLPERQNIFQDVLEQLAQREEVPPTGIFPMPSIQFLENLLDDLGTQGPATAGAAPVSIELPLNLPADAFDLDFRPMPVDQQQQQHQVAALAAAQLQRESSSYNVHAAALAQQAIAQPTPLGSAYLQQVPPGMVPSVAMSLPIQQQQQQQQAAAYATAAAASARGFVGSHVPASMHLPDLHHGLGTSVAMARTRGPAPAAAAMRRGPSTHEDMTYEEHEVSVQISKSGRVRKVASFTGNKRKSMGDSGHAALPRHMVAEMQAVAHNTASESHDSWRSNGDDSGSEVSKNSKGSRGGRRGKKGKRTTCLNCGCHQTPQWRCGPLGPRTLCNACGVRYKKGLPLNCWPLRDGMTLPQGIELPPGVREQIPAHWTINYVAAPSESS